MEKLSKLGPCSAHATFSDAEDWKEYNTRKIIEGIKVESVKAAMIDEAAELRKQADRLLRLAGRL